MDLPPGTLPPEWVERARAGGLRTADDLLAAGDVALSVTLLTGLANAREAAAAVAAAVAPTPVDALSMLKREEAARAALPTGLPLLDRALRGGLAPGQLVELVGPAGAGKTQACLSLVAEAATRPLLWPGGGGAPPAGAEPPPGGVVYIDTEGGAFQPTRLAELLRARFPGVYDPATAGAGPAGEALRDALSRVVLHSPHTLGDLLGVVGGLEDDVLAHRVGLVVVDSVAAAARREGATGAGGGGGGLASAPARVEALVRLASALKALADTFRIAVVCVNQVTTAVGGGGGPGGGWDAAASVVDDELRPALGPTWAHCVNTRLLLGRPAPGGGGGGGGGERAVVIVKSSVAPPLRVPFVVGRGGLAPPPAGDAGGGL